MEAERDLFPVIKIWGIQKGFCAQQPHRVLLGFSGSYLHTWKHGLCKGSPSVWTQEVES